MISDINFSPSIGDFAVIATPLIIAILISAIIVGVTNYIIGKSFSLIGKRAKSDILREMAQLYSSSSYIWVLLLFIVLVITFKSTLLDTGRMGYEKAGKETFTEVVNEANTSNKELVIYHTGGQMVTKQYDPASREFSKDYEVKNIEGRNFRLYSIR